MVKLTSSNLDDGDEAWVMLSTVLVLGMLPGLAFFEAGLLNHRTTVSLFMQMFCGLALLALMWIVVGYRSEAQLLPADAACFTSMLQPGAWPRRLVVVSPPLHRRLQQHHVQ